MNPLLFLACNDAFVLAAINSASYWDKMCIRDRGELMIDGVGTGIKAGKAEAGKPSIKIEGGNWWLINEKGGAPTGSA